MRKRLRSTIKWSGTVLTVLLLVVWVGSAWWMAGFTLEPTGTLAAYAGKVSISWQEPWSIIPVDGRLHRPRRHSEPFSWWFDASRATMGGVTRTGIAIPIWVLVVLFATPTLWLWRCDRRRRPGLCLKCGYDLRGADHKVCPECGTPPPRPSPAPPQSRRRERAAPGSGRVG